MSCGQVPRDSLGGVQCCLCGRLHAVWSKEKRGSTPRRRQRVIAIGGSGGAAV